MYSVTSNAVASKLNDYSYNNYENGNDKLFVWKYGRIVICEGFMQKTSSVSSPQTLTVSLPQGYRPKNKTVRAVLINNVTDASCGQVNIFENGTVNLYNANGNAFSANVSYVFSFAFIA